MNPWQLSLCDNLKTSFANRATSAVSNLILLKYWIFLTEQIKFIIYFLHSSLLPHTHKLHASKWHSYPVSQSQSDLAKSKLVHGHKVNLVQIIWHKVALMQNITSSSNLTWGFRSSIGHTVFWDKTTCSFVHEYQCFTGRQNYSTLEMVAVITSETLVSM